MHAKLIWFHSAVENCIPLMCAFYENVITLSASLLNFDMRLAVQLPLADVKSTSRNLVGAKKVLWIQDVWNGFTEVGVQLLYTGFSIRLKCFFFPDLILIVRTDLRYRHPSLILAGDCGKWNIPVWGKDGGLVKDETLEQSDWKWTNL